MMPPPALILLLACCVACSPAAPAGGKLVTAARGRARVRPAVRHQPGLGAHAPAAHRAVDDRRPAAEPVRGDLEGARRTSTCSWRRASARSRPDGPWYRPGMRPDEIRDVLLDALRERWLEPCQRQQPAPGALRRRSTASASSCELTHENGLRYRGTFAAAEHDGKLTPLVLDRARRALLRPRLSRP